jgi:hypothetical protein
MGSLTFLRPFVRRRDIDMDNRRRPFMSASKKPLKPDDFPLNAEGPKLKKQDGTPIADTDGPALAADIADPLNDDEARREEDKWSA